jgi:hypothetical protein
MDGMEDLSCRIVSAPDHSARTLKILKWLWVAIGHPITIDYVLFNASLGPVTLNHFFPPALRTNSLSVLSEAFLRQI